MSRIYDIRWYETIDSTNSEAQREMPRLGNLTVVASRFQTAGRGQRGNHWSSKASQNLTFSIVLKYGDNGLPQLDGIHLQRGGYLPQLDARDQFDVSRLTVIALLNYLADNGIHSLIKWPNDIYVGNNKICGILIEHSVRSDKLSSTVIGIGLNLNQTIFPTEVPNPTSMKLETGRSFDPEAELRNFLVHFDSLLGQLFTEEGRADLKEIYDGRIYRLNETTEFIRPATGEHFFGAIRAVEKDGRLVIENETASMEKFAFKEVVYVIPRR